jgi:hypothetical protein
MHLFKKLKIRYFVILISADFDRIKLYVLLLLNNAITTRGDSANVNLYDIFLAKVFNFIMNHPNDNLN